ncbi:DNA-dependent RNA polymerase subunit epsilon [Virgibacillus salexigens]|uniref:DNA-dependent RNA polymerase subunit epsilon n=1 Tax=Virgibacillus salexigens TaxID=61016 RepID=UPI00190E49E4|nr:RNA polymerase epsilon subunit [Virgibacillus salexigens]
MVYKALYQELPDEIPGRERTKSVYVEGESVRQVRTKLNERKYNIEFIQEVNVAHLDYEKLSDDFTVENI